MSYKHILKASIFFALGLLCARSIFAKSKLIGRLSETPLAEGAWARGMYGVTMSAGLRSVSIDQSALSGSTDNKLSIKNLESFTWQTFGFTKGIIWPLDFNTSFSLNPDNNIIKWNSVVQYSLYQRPFQPSFALRANYGTMHRQDLLDVKTYGVSIATSWGYRHFSVFANQNLGMSSSASSLESLSGDTRSIFTQAGLQYKLNPLSKLSLSRTWDQGSTSANELKISVGL